jgi:RND family efflux transporter MFP subunit
MVRITGQIVLVVVGMAAGFTLSMFIPMGGPPMGMMDMGEMPPPAVKAVELKERPLDVLDEYIAAVEPVQQVQVRSEVSGYLDALYFTEGAFVQEGDLLFRVDPKRYQATVELRGAELARAQAERDRAEKYLSQMRKADARGVSQADVDSAESAQLQALANLKQAEANLNLAKIDLAYSEIRAPISGRIGAAMLTKGNYVNAAVEVLAHIVQTDPIRIVFSMTDRAYLDFRGQVSEGRASDLAAQVKLPNGVVLPARGKKDFDDNQMNAKTGTLAVRYLFENPNELLVSGAYVNIMLGQPERPMGIRIPQRALLMDPDGPYVLTATEAGLVGVARVSLGSAIESDVEVTAGLKPGDRVVLDGVQKVQPGVTATVTLLEMTQ